MNYYFNGTDPNYDYTISTTGSNFNYTINPNQSFTTSDTVNEFIKNVACTSYVIDAFYADQRIWQQIDLEILVEFQRLTTKQIKDYICPMFSILCEKSFVANQFAIHRPTIKELLLQYQKINISDIVDIFGDIDEMPEREIKILSRYQCLDLEFITKYAELLSWPDLLQNELSKLSYSEIVSFIDTIARQDALDILITSSTWLNKKQQFDILKLIADQYESQLNWKNISWCVDLDEDFIFNHIDLLDFRSIRLCKRKYNDPRITSYILLQTGDHSCIS